MRILLDECIDRRLAKMIVGHDVQTVPQAGWASMANGSLLALAAEGFDVFITVDRNLSFQQNLPSFDIAVVVLRAPSNRLVDLQKLVPRILELLPRARRGESMTVGGERPA